MDLPVSLTVTGLKNPDRSTSQGSTKLSLVDRMGCRILFYKKAVMPKKESNKNRKRRKKDFLFFLHSFSFSFFLHFFIKTLHEFSEHGKYLALCGHVAACAERVHSGRERAGYVAASESVSSSFCAVPLEKILYGLPDRPKTQV